MRINPKKIIFASKASKRFVTGIVLSNDGSISLGRSRKRKIRSQIYKILKYNQAADGERAQLRGMIAFARDIEPDFISRMERKFGKTEIKSI